MNLRRYFIVGLCFLVSATVRVEASDPGAVAPYIIMVPTDPEGAGVTHQQALLAILAAASTTTPPFAVTFDPTKEIDFPAIGGNVFGVVGLTHVQADAIRDTTGYLVEEDKFEVVPASGTGAAAGPQGWALNQITGTGSLPVGCMHRAPTLYVIDTGVQRYTSSGSYHPELAPSAGIDWPAGPIAWMAGMPSGDEDPWNHGTGVASAALGATTGVLSQLNLTNPIKATVRSYRIYPNPSNTTPTPTAWTSDAVNAILSAAYHYRAVRSDGDLENDGGVLVFANRTANFSEAIEWALWSAHSYGGLTVVAAAGNDTILTKPDVPIWSAKGAFPAISSPTGITFGRLWPAPYDAGWAGSYAISPTFVLMAGGLAPPTIANPSLAPWYTASNRGPSVNFVAPAESVNIANAAVSTGGPATRLGTGTSFAAGYLAGGALYFAGRHPWAAPVKIRNFLDMNSVPNPIASNRPELRLNPLVLAPTGVPTFEEWIRAKGHNHYLARPPTADPDRDTLANSLEYWLGSDPTKATPSPQPVWIYQVPGTTSYKLRTTRNRYFDCGTAPVTVQLQRSTNLKTWINISSSFVLVSPAQDIGEGHVVETSIAAPTNNTFYRLVITL
jgi:Subtilase family